MTGNPLFDRSIPEPLVDVLRPDGGKLGGLMKLVSASPELDLQLRRSPKTKTEGWVTLYVGVTKAFDLFGRVDGRLRVKPQKYGPFSTATEQGWDRWGPADGFAAEAFLTWARAMIDASRSESSGKASNEGALQARVARGVPGWFRAIDRETMFAFANREAERDGLGRIRESLAPLVGRVQADFQRRAASGAPGGDWTRKGANPSRKLDVLAVDHDGRVLVIEVKPGNQTGTLAWTPYQVAQYMAQCRAWVETCAHGPAILNHTLRQREQLGLAPEGAPVAEPIKLLPVIAVGLPVKSRVVSERMRAVLEQVRGLDPRLVDSLQIWAVWPWNNGRDGAIRQVELHDLSDVG